MATNILARENRTAPVTSTVLAPVDFAFTEENNPNPGILLSSLRQTGYTLETAIGDLADNPLDADADTVVIALDKIGEDWVVTVADDGNGMDLQALDQMMRLGSEAEHDLTKDLGAFGLGSTTASLSLGRRQHVITSPTSGTFLTAATDLDTIISSKAFTKHLGAARPAEMETWRQAFTRWGLEVPTTGTLVQVANCDNIGRSYFQPAVDGLRRYIGQTYRYFIRAGKRFFVNGEQAEAIDPLELTEPGVIRLFDDTFEYTFPKGTPRAGETEAIGVILVQLPDWGGNEANKNHGYTLDRSGFHILRNRREIVAHTTLGFYTRHPALSRFRGELLFPATLDQELGVSFMKSNWDVKMSQSLRDKVGEIVRPYIRQARKFYLNGQTTSGESVPHEEAARVIRQRSPFLRKPETVIEKRSPRQEQDNGADHKQTSKDGKARSPQETRSKYALGDLADFAVKDLGATAPMFEAHLIGRKVLIFYNGQHPFYERFILENRDNPANIAAVDYLVYSMATAELRALDDDTATFIERMREDMSFNMRQLLTT